MTSDNLEYPEIALSLSQPDSLDQLSDLGPSPSLLRCLKRLGCPKAGLNAEAHDWPVTHIHLGNEFCERLIPTPRNLEDAQLKTRQLGLKLTLVAPMLTDEGLGRFDKLLSLLPDGTEIVINDWGVLQRLHTEHTSLIPLLGRMLNKMIKDPRLPSEKWSQLHPYISQSEHFQSLLRRFNIGHMEMDVPFFAKAEQFNSTPLGLSVHLPYGYTLKGRMCRIGSLNQKDDRKFHAGHACQKECLTYWTRIERPGINLNTGVYSFQRGNTQFYRHSEAMTAAVWGAINKHWVRRLIFAGDWHENHSPVK